jgi:antitoxin YefM
MAIQTTYTEARANLARLCECVVDDRETVVIKRRGGRDVALIAADELASLEETAHLLRSPRNAGRLLTALSRVLKSTAQTPTVGQSRGKVGFGSDANVKLGRRSPRLRR